MKPTPPKRRPSVHITLARAARLHQLVSLMADRPKTRDAILSELGMGLRTFYREIELFKRCGVKVRHKDKAYILQATAEEAEGLLPFPDPQLSFAEMAELSRHPGEAAKRLAEMLDRVIHAPPPVKPGVRGRKRAKPRGSGGA